MKINREAQKFARELFRLSFVNNRLEAGKIREISQFLVDQKPRNYLQILSAFTRLVRLELEKRHAIIESPQPLDSSAQNSVLSDLTQQFGADLTSEFKTSPDLIGGLRIRVGSDVWDGSIRARLETLKEQL